MNDPIPPERTELFVIAIGVLSVIGCLVVEVMLVGGVL
jgi:hypothetical protein